MGYFYIIQFNNKTKYGISYDKPIQRIKSHQADMRKLDLDDTPIIQFIINIPNYIEIERYLKDIYKSEWVDVSFTELYDQIKDMIIIEEIHKKEITCYSPIDFINDYFNESGIKILKDLYMKYEDHCLKYDLLYIKLDEFILQIRKAILKNELVDYVLVGDTLYHLAEKNSDDRLIQEQLICQHMVRIKLL